jgi:hypothetical protein
LGPQHAHAPAAHFGVPGGADEDAECWQKQHIRIIIIIMVLLGLVEKVNINQTSIFW